MKGRNLNPLYKAFGERIRLHRERPPKMTQEDLGRLVGLSRTSITNIEKGRQHIALHQLLDLANALNVSPHLLLPESGGGETKSWVTEKMPEGIEPKITEWAEKIVGE